MCQHLEIKININKNGGTHCIQTLYYDREGKIDVQTKVKFERVCVCACRLECEDEWKNCGSCHFESEER